MNRPASSPVIVFALALLVGTLCLAPSTFGAPAQSQEHPTTHDMIDDWSRDLPATLASFIGHVMEAVREAIDGPSSTVDTGEGDPNPPAPVEVPPSDDPVQSVGPGMVPIG